MTDISKISDIPNLRTLRLQRFLARAGAASRRGSENLMTAGRVTVNGLVVTELGSKVDPATDTVCVDGHEVHFADNPTWLMLNKPLGYVTTMSDPRSRPTVAELVADAKVPGLFPLGRLDRDTTGLLLFSTDGEAAHRLLHPKHKVTKTYHARVVGHPCETALTMLREGIVLDDGLTAPAEVEVLQQHEADTLLAIGIHEGRKRQVRRMCAALGHPVTTLHRSTFGPLALGTVAQGTWRPLTPAEVTQLTRYARI